MSVYLSVVQAFVPTSRYAQPTVSDTTCTFHVLALEPAGLQSVIRLRVNRHARRWRQSTSKESVCRSSATNKKLRH